MAASFKSLNIGTRLLLGFGLVLACMVTVTILALARMASISAAVEHQAAVQRERLDPLYVAREALDQTGLAARNAYIFTDAGAARQELAILDRERATRVFYGGAGDPNGSATRGLLDIPGWEGMAYADAAQAVQISAYPDRYAQWESPATTWIAVLG